MVYPGHGPETNIGYENNTIHSLSVGFIKFCKKSRGIVIMNTTLEKLKERIKDKNTN